MRRSLFIMFLFITSLQSCKYKPYLKYYHASKKTGTPRFTKWEKYVGSNSNPLRACYDVTCYDWNVSVDPEKKKLSATMRIYFRMEQAQDSIMLDLERHMKIDQVKSNVPLKKWRRKKDVLYFIFEKDLSKNTSVILEITYHGTPVKILSYSSVYWRKDKNKKPWISTSTEGIGPHHMMPCKILLGDEADSCFIHVGAPKNLVAVANGKLEGITETPSQNIYNWSVKNPINIYNISFNIGDYIKLVKDYTDVNGVKRKIEAYPLSYNKIQADTFYDQGPVIMKNFERLYGTFPWWNDGCKFIESSLIGSAMEHQSGISMDQEDYYYDFKKSNTTLIHELSHEWWGNNITGYDYADLWLHEGFASYSEFLMIEALYGEKDYNMFVQYYAANGVKNKRPVLKTYGVLYNSMITGADQDIYYKGAMLLHTLRRQLNNDEMFFRTLKKAQVVFAKSNITTKQFADFYSKEVGKDFTLYFDLYLKQIVPPSLEFSFTPIDSTSSTMKYKWKNKLPENFSMKVMVDFRDTTFSFFPTNTWQEVKVPAKQLVNFNRAKFGYILAEKIKP